MEQRLFTYTFLEEYQQHIRPAIKEIDVFLRSSCEPICAKEAACVLDLDVAEVLGILTELGLGGNTMSRQVFLMVMERGSSPLCCIFGREMEIGSPPTYTAAQIAYIYGLEETAVKKAFQKLRIKEVTLFVMPLVFAEIPYSI